MSSAIVKWKPRENQVYCMDALDLLRQMDDGSVDLIVTDPPYMGVKDDDWDNQWASEQAFLTWLECHLKEFRRVLRSNGSLYLFASPYLGSKVELKVNQYFNVLNRITWRKPPYSTKAEMFDKEMMRSYFPASEVIIFAEQYGSDQNASGEAGYHEVYEEAKRQLKYTILADYLSSEFDRAGVSRKQIAALFPSKTGGLTGCVSNWLLGYNIPTADQYQKMRLFLNTYHANGSGEYLRHEYEYLRREYEDLRREYEDLRRPFNMTSKDQYTDVWTFKTVNTYPGKHPAEKPYRMIDHIIRVSSRPGNLVLDCFCGSGTTLDAARQNGRQYIGCDNDPKWSRYAANRVAMPFNLDMFETLGVAV